MTKLEILWKIGLTMMFAGAILLTIFQAIFDKGDKYTSPEFEKKWQEYIFQGLVWITMSPLLIAAIILMIAIFKFIWR